MNEHSFILSELRHEIKVFLSRCGNFSDDGPGSGPSSPKLLKNKGGENRPRAAEVCSAFAR
jgi:hypothetical protein